jgi:hypothetical protein
MLYWTTITIVFVSIRLIKGSKIHTDIPLNLAANVLSSQLLLYQHFRVPYRFKRRYLMATAAGSWLSV